jgi:spore coat protein CotH
MVKIRGRIVGFGIIFLMLMSLFADSRGKTAALESTAKNWFENSSYVADIHIVMKESDWQELLSNASAKQYVRANFSCDRQMYENVAVRPKGEGSLLSSVTIGRIPLKIDFNFFNVGQEFRGIKKLSLNNCYNDPSMMREVLGYWLYEQMGVPTPKRAFADVWVNDIHLGLYTMVEQIDKTFLRNHFAGSKGDLYKPAGAAGALGWTKKDMDEKSPVSKSSHPKIDLDVKVGGARLGRLVTVLQKEGFNGSQRLLSDANATTTGANRSGTKSSEADGDLLEQMSVKTNENTTKHKPLFKLLEALNNCPDKSFPTEIEKVLNVDQSLRYFAVSTLMVHLDNYTGSGQNYYLYEDNGKFTLIPWDLNEAFGGYSTGIEGNPADYNVDSLVNNKDRPLISRLLAYKPYLDKYHQCLEKLINGPFSVTIDKRIDEIAYVVEPVVSSDGLKFFGLDDFRKNVGRNIDSGSNQSKAAVSEAAAKQTNGYKAPLLKEFIKQRRESVAKQLAALRYGQSEKTN